MVTVQYDIAAFFDRIATVLLCKPSSLACAVSAQRHSSKQ